MTPDRNTSSYPQIEAWSELLSFVCNNEHSSFYRNLYSKANFNPKENFNGLQDIKNIPFVTKKDLLAAESLCFVSESEVRSLSSTSGTTGVPLVTFHTPSPITESALKPEHNDFGVSLVLFSPMRAGSILYSYHQRKQAVILGDIHNLPATCAFAAAADVRTLVTTPTLAILLRKYIDTQPELLKSLKYLRLGGETISPSKKEYLRSLYPDTTIFTAYASSEVGWAAFQCIHLANRDEVLYHPNTAGFHLEIVDDELVVTDFTNLATPMIRYCTGDRAEFINRQCDCGRSAPLISIKGRIDNDSVRAGGFEIRRDMIEPVILKLQYLICHDFEAHVYETYVDEKPFIRMVVKLALREGTSDSPETRNHLVQGFNQFFKFSPTMSFIGAKETGLFAPLEFEFVTFPEGAKTTEKIILN